MKVMVKIALTPCLRRALGIQNPNITTIVSEKGSPGGWLCVTLNDVDCAVDFRPSIVWKALKHLIFCDECRRNQEFPEHLLSQLLAECVPD